MKSGRILLGACAAALAVVGAAQAQDAAAPPDPAKAAAELQKLQAEAKKTDAEARKADAEAKKADIESQTAEVEAAQKVLPSSGKSSTISTKDAAGQMEASLLANRELSRLTAGAAVAINRAIHDDCVQVTCARRTLLIMGPNDNLHLARLRTFDLRRKTVSAALQRAMKIYEEEAGRAAPTSSGKEAGFVGAGAATAVVQLANLASYFATTTEMSGLTVTPKEQAMIATLLANLRRVCSKNDVFIANRVGTPAATQAVVNQLIALDELAYDASVKLADAKSRAAQAKKGKKGEEAAEAGKPWDDVATNLAKAIEGYSAFLTTLADDKGGLPLAGVLQEQALADVLARGYPAYQIFPTYDVAGGGAYTQTNLWTVTLGVLPFHVSGGSGVSYSVVRASDGAALEGGTVEGATSYIPVKKIGARLDEAKPLAIADPGYCT